MTTPEASLQIIPLTDNIGAEVRGVDLSRPVSPGIAAELQAAWHDYVLLLFRDQALNDDHLKASTGWLGDMSEITMPTDRRGDDDLSIALVSNILDAAGKPIGALGDGDMWFHHDNSFTSEPDKATFLYAVELPSKGGNTLFGNGYLAWDALPDHLRRDIEGRQVCCRFMIIRCAKNPIWTISRACRTTGSRRWSGIRLPAKARSMWTAS